MGGGFFSVMDFGFYANDIHDGSTIYNQLIELERGQEVLISGTLDYKGWRTPTLTGEADHKLSAKFEKRAAEFLLGDKDSEAEERQVIKHFWFEVKLDSVKPAPKEVEKVKKEPEPTANLVSVPDGTVPATLRGTFKMVSGELCAKKRTKVTLSKHEVRYKSRKAKSDCTRKFAITGTELDGKVYTLKVAGQDDFEVVIAPKGIEVRAAPNYKLKGKFKGKRSKK
jgi:hypothetical protein